MRKIILLVLLLTLSILAQAQEDSISVPKWSYEIMFAPNMSNRILTGSEDEAWYREDRNNMEVARIGYSVKIGIIRSLSDLWSIGSGLTYSNIGYKTKATELTWVTPYPDFPTELRSSSQYTYLGIPILTYYKLAENRRWTTELILGASFNFFLNKNVISEIKIDDTWVSYPNKGFIYNEFNLFGIAGLGAFYRLNNSWQFKTSIVLNQSLTPSNSMSKTKEYLNFISLNVGVNYRFAKRKDR